GKSTLLQSIARAAGMGFVFVEGNAELTPARLVGHHDPSRVMTEGYSENVFVDGPLLRALREGALLYVEEINRVAEETLNVLVGVMSEGMVQVPRLGRVEASDHFRIVAAMNPFDSVGTARISSSIYDRSCRVSMDYQTAFEEREIVLRRTAHELTGREPDTAWLDQVVSLVRRTRAHRDIRVGSSVRGAIDLTLVADNLGRIRGTDHRRPDVCLDAALTSLSGRIKLDEGCGRSPEQVIEELWSEVFADRRPGDVPVSAEMSASGDVPAPANEIDGARGRSEDQRISAMDRDPFGPEALGKAGAPGVPGAMG
ncbi:MAG TPA: MoxR family ATPase, partial [Acidimicrobiales bacterium]|nr:MoxR family ATPase [Acidimicrobiales bacterium]